MVAKHLIRFTCAEKSNTFATVAKCFECYTYTGLFLAMQVGVLAPHYHVWNLHYYHEVSMLHLCLVTVSSDECTTIIIIHFKKSLISLKCKKKILEVGDLSSFVLQKWK